MDGMSLVDSGRVVLEIDMLNIRVRLEIVLVRAESKKGNVSDGSRTSVLVEAAGAKPGAVPLSHSGGGRGPFPIPKCRGGARATALPGPSSLAEARVSERVRHGRS